MVVAEALLFQLWTVIVGLADPEVKVNQVVIHCHHGDSLAPSLGLLSTLDSHCQYIQEIMNYEL